MSEIKKISYTGNPALLMQESAGASVKYTFFRRTQKSCPFSDPNNPKKNQRIDYKDVSLLVTFLSPDKKKIIPRRVSAVSAKKQRELKQAIKRARFMALLPYLQK